MNCILEMEDFIKAESHGIVFLIHPYLNDLVWWDRSEEPVFLLF